MIDNLSLLHGEPGTVLTIDGKRISVYADHVKLADGTKIDADENGMVEVYGKILIIAKRPGLVYTRAKVRALTTEQIEDMPLNGIRSLVENDQLRLLNSEQTDAFIKAFNKWAESLGARFRVRKQAGRVSIYPINK